MFCIARLCAFIFTLVTGFLSRHCTRSLQFIWTLNLASLQPVIAPLGWDNWFSISHGEGWNNIQDGRDDRDLASFPLMFHILISVVCWPSARKPIYPGFIVAVYTSGFFFSFFQKKCWQWAELSVVTVSILQKAETCSSGLRDHHAPTLFALADPAAS